MVEILANAFLTGLSEEQLGRLFSNRHHDICCGHTSWLYVYPPGKYAPEVLANLDCVPKYLAFRRAAKDWRSTFLSLCKASGVLMTPIVAYMSNVLDEPLTNYTNAMQQSDARTVRTAIETAYDRSKRQHKPWLHSLDNGRSFVATREEPECV